MYLTQQQLQALDFKKLGYNVLISDKASIYGAGRISIGSNVRIDDFTIISAGEGGIDIGDYVHIACYVSIIGKAKVTLEDLVGVSGRTSIYSSTDDFSGKYLHGVTLPEEYIKVFSAEVVVKLSSVIGAGCVVLPGTTIGSNCAIGALSVVKGNIPPDEIHGGVPAKKIGERDTTAYMLAEKLLGGEKAIKRYESYRLLHHLQS